MGFDDYLRGKMGRDQVAKYAWAILSAVLKEVGEVALAEFSAALDTYRKERKTPDGWTEEEYLTYAIGRLRVLQERKIGPWVVDEVLDWAIQRIVDVLEGKLDGLDADDPADADGDDEPIPAPQPTPEPPPAPSKDPYYPTLYGPFEPVPFDVLKKGDLVYKTATNRFVVPFIGRDMPIYVQATRDATLISVVGED